MAGPFQGSFSCPVGDYGALTHARTISEKTGAGPWPGCAPPAWWNGGIVYLPFSWSSTASGRHAQPCRTGFPLFSPGCRLTAAGGPLVQPGRRGAGTGGGKTGRLPARTHPPARPCTGCRHAGSSSMTEDLTTIAGPGQGNRAGYGHAGRTGRDGTPLPHGPIQPSVRHAPPSGRGPCPARLSRWPGGRQP